MSLASAVFAASVFLAACSPSREGSGWKPDRDEPCEDVDDIKLRSDADIEELDGKEVQALVISDEVTSLLGLANLTNVLCLTIEGTDNLLSLDGLNGLSSIEGGIWIKENKRLASLSGLEGLRTVRDLMIEKNHELGSLDGLANLERVEGKFELVNNPSLTSLAGLKRLTFAGELLIEEIPGLFTLAGLESLETVEGFYVVKCEELRNLSGVDNLTAVWGDGFGAGDLEMIENDNLMTLTGLENLKRVKDITILDNKKLVSLEGLEGLKHAEGIKIDGNEGLLSLAGLDNIESIEEQLILDKNEALASVDGLERLQSVRTLHLENNPELASLAGLKSLRVVEKELTIRDTEHLNSLSGLESLETVGRLVLMDNIDLEYLDGLKNLAIAFQGIILERMLRLDSLSGLHSLRHSASLTVDDIGNPHLDVLGSPVPPGGSIDVFSTDDRSWPHCVTPHERDVLVRSVKLPENSKIPSASWERWRQNSCGWELFTCVLGKACRFVLDGNNGAVRSLFISDPNGGCGICPVGHRQRNVTFDGEVDFGFALEGEQAGNRSVCHCDRLGPIAQLLLRGPVQTEAPTICARGSECVVKLDGEALKPGDDVVLTTGSCEVPPPAGAEAEGLFHSASWAAAQAYTPETKTWFAAPPTRYEVCWRAPCTAQGVACQGVEQETKFFKAGYVELHGMYSKYYGAFSYGDGLRIPNTGFGVADGDRLRLRKKCGKADNNSDGSLEVASMSMEFDFGPLTADRLGAGNYHLCWCRPGDGISCTSEEQFIESGSVDVECPPGEENTGLGLCQRCQAGRHQPETGLDPCTLCPAGSYSVEGARDCNDCQDGTFALLAGSPTCVPCQPWESSDANHVDCSVDLQKVVLSLLFLLCVGVFCIELPQVILVRHTVVDVSRQEDRILVTVLKSHGLSHYGARSFLVKFKDTGHPGLDSPKAPLHARVKDAARLELITTQEEFTNAVTSEEKEKERLDTSMGSFALAFPRDLLHKGWPVPVAFTLPLLWITAWALGGVMLGNELGVVLYLAAPVVALVCAAASTAFRLLPDRTPLSRRLAEFALEPSHTLKRSGKGPSRAISVGKLHDLLEYFRDFIQDRTAYYLTSCVLNQLTKSTKLSYAEWTGPGEVEWFVSHYWGTAFEHFCNALQKHASSVSARAHRDWTTVNYWVCFCSNNQHLIEEEIGVSWQESSFFLTLRSGLCRGTCMVLDDKALPLTRAWCIFELLQTLMLERDDQAFKGLLLCTSSGVLNDGGGSVEVATALARRVAEVDLGSARASHAKDEEMIRNYVSSQLGDFEKLNVFIRTKVRLMLMSAKSHASVHFDTVLASLAGLEVEREATS